MMRAVLVMAKAPIAGRSKTRLMPRLTAEQAAELSACFIRDSVELVETLEDTDVIVAISPSDSQAIFSELLVGRATLAQHGVALGDRLAHVLTTGLARGYDQVIAINSDSPTLPRSLVVEAFAKLGRERTDLVLGPATDGGYYLIGWKKPLPATVVEVTMSTPNVLADTLAIAERDGLETSLLSHWYDVDTPTDLDRLLNDIASGMPCGRWTREFLSSVDPAGTTS